MFGALYLYAMHLKIMRIYIDGVLRFGIPPTFNIFTIKTANHGEKKILEGLTKEFADPS
jgi:hypothetical protein